MGLDPMTRDGPAVLFFEGFRFDLEAGLLEREGEELHLPPRAVAALRCLLGAPGDLVSREELEAAVSGGSHVTRRSVPEAILVLRRALGDSASDPRFIQTVPRRGYRFIAPVRRHEPVGSPADRVVDRLPSLGLAGVVGLTLSAGALLVIALAATRGTPGGRAAGVAPTIRATLALSAPLQADRLDGRALALSADGRRLAYVARETDGSSSVRIEHLDRRRTTVIADAGSRPRAPFLTDDGARLGFVSDGQLFAAGTDGGRPTRLCRVGRRPNVAGAWTRRGDVVFSGGPGVGLWLCEPDRGEVRPLTEPGPGERAHRWPTSLPDGRILLGVEPVGASDYGDFALAVLDPGTGELRRLAEEFGGLPVYAHPGEVLAVRRGRVIAAPLDLESATLGEVRVLPVRLASGARSGAQFTAAAGGTLAFVEAAAGPPTLTWIEPGGSRHPAPGMLPTPGDFDLAPSGRVVVEVAGDLHVWDPATSTSIPRVEHAAHDASPVWGPAGVAFYFASNRSGAYGLFRLGPDDRTVSLLLAPSDDFPTSVTPDGEGLVFGRVDEITGEDIWLLPLQDPGEPRPLVRTEANESHGEVSPDGDWLAFVADDSGCPRVYVAAMQDLDGRIQVSRRCALDPAWAADGPTLGYRTLDGSVMLATVEAGIKGGPAPARLYLRLPEIGAFLPEGDFRRLLVRESRSSGASDRVAYLQAGVAWLGGLDGAGAEARR